MTLLVIVMVALLVYVRAANRETSRMAERSFSVARLPGFATMAIVVFVILYLPIITLVVYSFNASASVSVWAGFSLRLVCSKAWANRRCKEATIRSLVIAASASAIATTVAHTGRSWAPRGGAAFKGQTVIYVMINQPLMVPEIVTAVALLILFAIDQGGNGLYTGLGYLIIAHAAFCIPFAYLPIRARLEGMDLSLETAAGDLYATPLADLPPCDPALAGAGDHCGGDAGLCDQPWMMW